MHISRVDISNCKSFLEKQTFQFEPGFNLLLGANNAGKTTVLDAIDLNASLNAPHRSVRTIPVFGGKNPASSNFEVTMEVRLSELWQAVGSTQMYLPLAPQPGAVTDAHLASYLHKLVDADAFIKVTSMFRDGEETVNVFNGDLIGGIANRNAGATLHSALLQHVAGTERRQISVAMYGGVQKVVGNYAQLLKPKIYRFSAQRRPGFVCGSSTPVLDREAVALPYCINYLQTNDAHGHRQLCEWIHRVFPSVKWIQSPPLGNGNFELRCLPNLPEERRDDLAVPMQNMGAGIGNVIAMFYVVLTSREPQVIAIDEPNAFLHPRALREMLAILEVEGKQHQFLVTAHSADVLTSVNARTISMLDFDGVTTTVSQVGLKDLHELRGGLADLGIRMTDLHAKDRVLWVEGQTEELVMPELLRWSCPEIAAGVSVLRVERTGTFTKKSIEPIEVAGIYDRLSGSSALVPPMICILLDGELRSRKVREELQASSGGKLRFLERRMLENYLLHPEAIAAVLTELGSGATSDMVKEALCEALGVPDLPSDLHEIDAANALKSAFAYLSESKEEFRKTRDVPTLVTWILDNDPSYLAPLRESLRQMFGLQATSGSG